MALPTEPVAPQTHDLSEDGALSKTILVEGEGEEAGRGARVAVRYALYLPDEKGSTPFDSSVKRKDGILEFTLGRKKVIPALELVAQSMKLGEKCKAKAEAPYAFGSRGLKRKGVLPNSTIFMEVEMVRFEGGEKKKTLADMSPNERFEEAKTCKETGNTFFKEQKYDKALTQYTQGIRYLSNVFYKPSSALPSRVDKSVGNSSTKSTSQEEVPEENGKADEGGFDEAQVIDAEGQDDADVSAEQDAEQLVKKPAQVTTTEPLPIITNGDEKTENGTADAGKSDTEQAIKRGSEETEVVETVDISTATAVVTENNVNSQLPENGVPDEGAATGEAENGSTSQPSASADAEENVPESDDPEEEEVRALHVTTLNNLSLCFVKLENYKRAVETASFALKIDPTSSKALYYRYVSVPQFSARNVRKLYCDTNRKLISLTCLSYLSHTNFPTSLAKQRSRRNRTWQLGHST